MKNATDRLYSTDGRPAASLWKVIHALRYLNASGITATPARIHKEEPYIGKSSIQRALAVLVKKYGAVKLPLDDVPSITHYTLATHAHKVGVNYNDADIRYYTKLETIALTNLSTWVQENAE